MSINKKSEEDIGSSSQGLADPSETFDKLQALLKAKDPTSRFVGLALLKTVLDNGQLSKDQDKIRILWEAMSPKFLDGLLRAQQNEQVIKSDAKDMVDLAVSVLHTFTILLPEISRKEKRLTGRVAPLVNALIQSPSETTKLILQTLLTISSEPEGALEILNLKDVSPLIEIASEYSMVLEVVGFAWINLSVEPERQDVVRESMNKILPKLILTFKGTDAVTLIEFVGSLLQRLNSTCLPLRPMWLEPLFLLLRKLITSKPTAKSRAAYTQLAAALLQAYPTRSPDLLFKGDASKTSDRKPFSYLFINLLLIDIRSSFPSLLAQLNSPQYPATSQRLAAAFDVVSCFIGFLVRSLDDDSGSSLFSMPPDLLLRLRKDISETVSLTVEYLRDRWDASIAGASGLHPSAINATAATSEGTRLTLTWESMKDDVKGDALILAGIRAIAIWIREDDNENLRSECAGLMDMFMELYKVGSKGPLDFRYPVLLALEGIMTIEDGVERFISQEGWQTLSDDLQILLRETSRTGVDENFSIVDEASRGLQIVRVLLAVLDNEATSYLEESWMEIIKITSSIKVLHSSSPVVAIEFQVAMLQLSTALMNKASGGMMKRHITSHGALSGLTQQLMVVVGGMNDKIEGSELLGLLDDVALDLENLR